MQPWTAVHAKACQELCLRCGCRGFNFANKTDGCFPAAAQVELADGTSVTMAALKVGDVVRVQGSGTGAAAYSKVYMFTHRDAEVKVSPQANHPDMCTLEDVCAARFPPGTALTVGATRHYTLFPAGQICQDYHVHWCDVAVNLWSLLVRKPARQPTPTGTRLSSLDAVPPSQSVSLLPTAACLLSSACADVRAHRPC